MLTAFLRLVDHSSAIDASFLDKQKDAWENLQKRDIDKEFENLRQEIGWFSAASKLRALPESSNGDADYYRQLREYLKWVKQGKNGQRSKVKLIHKIQTASGGQINQRDAKLRADFLESLTVIQGQAGETVCLTDLGKAVINDSETQKTAIAMRIFEWCEKENHDSNLRNLLRHFDEDGTELTIKNLMERLGFSSKTPKLVGDFRVKTCAARNWMVSTGVINLQVGRANRYSPGKNFPNHKGSLDASLNDLLGIEDDLKWLQEE